MTEKTEEPITESLDQKYDSFPIVGIGASAGGLDPIRELLGHLPSALGVSFVIIQHLASGQESLLPEILARSTKMQVVQVTDNMKVVENHVYVIPPGTTMTLNNDYLKLVPKVDSPRPINAFFASLALERKSQAIGIVLSGLGNDGTEGLKAIKAEGGITFAQEPKTAQYTDMPRNAIDSQVVDFILQPERIAKELSILAKHPNLIHAKVKELEIQLSKEETDLRKILMLIKTAFGVDFTHYKQTTINRRITRRLIINKSENLPQYVDVLRSNKKELQALFDDLLIGVTSFFREPKTFEVLKQKVFPQIVQDRSPSTEKLRFWVPACSTGEEAYSLAIALQEFLQDNDIVDIGVQIFGTDANEKSIEKARQGTYPKAIEENVSEARLKQFFIKIDGRYQIAKPIRDMCVFAKHDITTDPPFSNLDLIICRNLLIYFDSYLQERVLPILHYGLKPDGFLVLGESESVGKFQYLFEPLTTKSTISKKKRAQPQAAIETETFVPFTTKKTYNPPQKIDAMTSLKQEIDNELIEQYVPATLLTNSNLDILFFRGQVNPYLIHESGAASFNVNKIVKKDLRPQVQIAILRAKKENKAATERVTLQEKERTRIVEIQVKPFIASKFDETFFFINFKESSVPALKLPINEEGPKPRGEDLREKQIRELTEDLIASKQTLQSLIESNEATTEELRSTIEEAQSSNEALQSTNEELETAKEELQSSNEELQTLNEELKNRNELLTSTNDDLTNLIKNVDTTVVIVDNSYRIRRATASAWGVLNIQPSDIGHSIVTTNIANIIRDLETKLYEVTSNLTQVVQEVAGQNGLYYELRIRPYLTSGKKIAGAVLTFVNVTERKLLELQQKGHTEKLEAHVKTQEAKLIASERMAAIGQTAGMVGHDLRNPLQTVVGELFLAQKALEQLPDSQQKGDLHESIAAITEQTQYMDKIVSDLQTFVKAVEVHKEKLSLKQLISSVIANIDVPSNVKIEVAVNNNLDLEADPQLLKRVLINLVTNAIQAMPKGGKITFGARSASDGYVEIIVEDTGIGISDEIKPQIFTPLFTTKSRGQGFGLAVCKRVIEAQGGTIEFESQVGKGTKFHIKLPSSPNK